MVVIYLLKDAIKHEWIHMNLSSKLIDILIVPSCEKMNLRRFKDLVCVT